MNPGGLRERVTIQSESRAADTAGGAVLSWVEVATVWAEVKPISGAEPVESEQLTPTVGYTITIRFRDDVTAANRIVWRGDDLQIRAVRSDAWRRFQYLDCESGVVT